MLFSKDPIQKAQSESGKILDRIRELQAEIIRIKHAPKSIEERTAAFNEKIDRMAEEYWSHEKPDGPGDLIQSGAQILQGSGLTNFSNVAFFEAAFFGDQMKQRFAEEIGKRATGKEMSSQAKADRLDACDVEIWSLWKEYERVVTEIETLGITMPRAGDLPPSIYLNFGAGGSYDEARFLRLEEASGAASATSDSLYKEAHRLAEEESRIKQQIYLLQHQGELPTESLRGGREWPSNYMLIKAEEEKLEVIKKKKIIVNEKRIDHSAQNKELRALVSACRSFLEKKGIDTNSTDRWLRLAGE